MTQPIRAGERINARGRGRDERGEPAFVIAGKQNFIVAYESISDNKLKNLQKVDILHELMLEIKIGRVSSSVRCCYFVHQKRS